MKSFFKQHAIFVYYLLMFTVSWGGFFLIGGRNFFSRTNWQTDPTFLSAILAMLAGPPVAGVVSTILVSGRAGLKDFLSRLFRWKAGVRWYAAALLIPLFTEVAVLFVLSLASPTFLPAVVTVSDKGALLMSGIRMGLMGGLVEELGWTGFAIPQFRVRYSIFTTGLIVGVLWGIWHMLQMWWVGGTSFGGLSPALFLIPYFLLAIATLTAFRIIMVWVYDHTKSLLLAILMHASYIFSTLFVFAPPTTGSPFLIYSGGFTILMWLVVAVIARATKGRLFEKAFSANG